MSFFDDLVSSGPIRDWLRSREPLLPRPKLFSYEYGDSFGFQITVPAGVSDEQAVAIIAQTPWAQQTAAGYARVMGLKKGTKAYDDAVQKWATHLATRAVTGEQSATARRRSRRG
jgi:hypothetical protein